MFDKEINEAVDEAKKIFHEKGITRVISHLDTDGLTSAAIISNVLLKNKQKFWLTTVKQLEDSIINELKEQSSKQNFKALFFLDLGSNKIDKIKKSFNIPVFILDHHELDSEFLSLRESNESEKNKNFNAKIYLIHSGDEKISAAGISYLFAKAFGCNKKLAQLGILGMIGDFLDKLISKSNNILLNDSRESGMKIKKGPTVFSAMRPLYKALEFSSSIFIPGVTGNFNGALEMLREIGIEVKNSKGWRTLIDLNEEELSRLITAILIRRVNDGRSQDIVDNIYLIKLGGQIWDAREVSTMLNACGRLNHSSTALAFLLGSVDAKGEVERVYSRYKHSLIKALNWIEDAKKIKGDNYVIVNAKSFIKDTIIGTVMSILTSSFVYPKGTVLIGMAYRPDGKIKISSRLVRDRTSRNENGDINLNKLLNPIIRTIGGEVGGHANAAGGLIEKDKENVFIELIEKELNLQQARIKIE